MGRVELRQRGDGWQVDLLGEIAALVTVGWVRTAKRLRLVCRLRRSIR